MKKNLYNMDGYHQFVFVPKWSWMSKVFKPRFTVVYYSGFALHHYDGVTNETIETIRASAIFIIKCPIGWTIKSWRAV